MIANNIYEQLGKLKILPAATLARPEDAVPLVEALAAGGLPCVEVMFRSNAAEAYGGTRTLTAMGGPYKQVRFIPTGGIGPANLNEYLALPSVLACGGSWMAKPDMIANGEYDRITELTREAVKIARLASR